MSGAKPVRGKAGVKPTRSLVTAVHRGLSDSVRVRLNNPSRRDVAGHMRSAEIPLHQADKAARRGGYTGNLVGEGRYNPTRKGRASKIPKSMTKGRSPRVRAPSIKRATRVPTPRAR